MKYLFYEHGELVAELDKCTVVSAADDAGVSTVLFNGKTYQRRKPVEFVQEWVAFDLVNKWAPSPVIPFDSLPEGTKTAEFWMKECRRWQTTFEELESKYSGVADLYSKSVIRHNETADRYAECRKERMQFQDRLGACSRALGSWLLPDGDIPQSIAKLVEHVSGLPSYHVNDGVGEDSPAMNPSVRYFKGQIAERDAKIRDLESRLEAIDASRVRSIDDYNKSVAREGRLREEIQRINLRLADSERERVRLRKQLEGQRDAALRAEVERLSTEVIDLMKQRDKAIAAHENAEYGAELLANANEGLTRSLDEMAKSLRAKSKECADRTEALNEARIDESRSTQNAERYQRKLYEIDQIIKK